MLSNIFHGIGGPLNVLWDVKSTFFDKHIFVQWTVNKLHFNLKKKKIAACLWLTKLLKHVQNMFTYNNNSSAWHFDICIFSTYSIHSKTNESALQRNGFAGSAPLFDVNYIFIKPMNLLAHCKKLLLSRKKERTYNPFLLHSLCQFFMLHISLLSMKPYNNFLSKQNTTRLAKQTKLFWWMKIAHLHWKWIAKKETG